MSFPAITLSLSLSSFHILTRRTPTNFSCFSGDSVSVSTSSPPPVLKKRNRYRKLYPGEREGITEEMRFVAMRLRNIQGNKIEDNDGDDVAPKDEGDDTWHPSLEGFVRFMVDSKVVFDTIERIVDVSDNVCYAYFRKTGLERSIALSNDLEWFSQQDISILTPSNPGITYAKYLEELAEKSAPLFVCHFYNIYFSHIAGGQVIAKQVSEKLLEGKELQFCTWEENDEELLKGVRDKLNMLGEHWTRDEKNKCLREATKAFQYMGQIVRLIIL